MTDLAKLRYGLQTLDDLTREAYVEEVLVVPMNEEAAKSWRQNALSDGEDWVYGLRGDQTLAIDRPSHLAHRSPIEGVVFPSLHSQMLGWWLFHAWRSIDLLKSALDSSSSGVTTVAAITTRALIEELGCLVTETSMVREAWQTAKLTNDVSASRRADKLWNGLAPLLTKMLFASRMTSKPADAPSATNVLTYVSKLDKLSKSSKFSEWYDWLSDASHPAFGARLVYVTNPLRHASGSTVLRLHSRSPLRLVDPRGKQIDFTYDIEDKAAAALNTCGLLIIDQLYAALRLVDDFGLTTSAAAFTKRAYWRDLNPVRPEDECPCSCGAWSQSLHSWGKSTPPLPPMAT